MSPHLYFAPSVSAPFFLSHKGHDSECLAGTFLTKTGVSVFHCAFLSAPRNFPVEDGDPGHRLIVKRWEEDSYSHYEE